MHPFVFFIIITALDLILVVRVIPANVTQFKCEWQGISEVPTNSRKAELTLEGHVIVKFKRSNLRSLADKNTDYSSVFIKHGDISFNGIFVTAKGKFDHQISWTIHTDIEAFQYKTKNNGAELMDVVLNTTKNIKNEYNLRTQVQDEIIQSVRPCIAKNLFELSRVKSHEGNMDVFLLDMFHDRYPSLMITNDLKKPDVQMSLNLLADFILGSLATQLSKDEMGKISGLPDLVGNDFIIKNASFRDLQSFQRVADVNLSVDGLHFMVEAEYQVSAFINGSFHAQKILDFDGFINLNLGQVRCVVKASINYSRIPCSIEVTDILIKLLDKPSFIVYDINWIKKELLYIFGNGQVQDEILNQVNEVMPMLIKQGVNDFVSSLVNCENFRP